MAKAIGGIKSFNSSLALTASLRAVWTLRLSLGLTTLLGATIFLIGTTWDIQWHSLIGRDRTLIPPHIMMLGGVALSGFAALAAILIETLWARHNQNIAQNSTPFADSFHGSLGAYIAGFAALDAAIAFPLDAYWHSLYGIDVAIWAPFHVMFGLGMGLVALGATYMLVSAARLATNEGAVGGKRAAYIGAIAAFGVMMGIFTLFLLDALGHKGFINLDFIVINIFPMLAALVIGWTFVATVFAVPWRWVATSVVGVYLLLALIFSAFVPPATGWLVVAEHLVFRRPNPGIAIVAFDWPLAPLLAAIGIDIVVSLARRKDWSRQRLMWAVLPIILIGSLPVLLFHPLYTLDLLGLPGGGFIATLLLGLAGAFIGSWFGKRMGEAMQQVERPQ